MIQCCSLPNDNRPANHTLKANGVKVIADEAIAIKSICSTNNCQDNELVVEYNINDEFEREGEEMLMTFKIRVIQLT